MLTECVSAHWEHPLRPRYILKGCGAIYGDDWRLAHTYADLPIRVKPKRIKNALRGAESAAKVSSIIFGKDVVEFT